MAALEKHDGPEPWERQDHEPARSFMAFQTYRDMGLLRSLRKLPPPGAMSAETYLRKVGRWSSEWGWPGRAKAYDQMMERERIGARIAAVGVMEERHAQIAEAALGALAMPLVALGQPRMINGAPVGDRLLELQEMPTADLIRLAAHASRSVGRLTAVERLARRQDEELPGAQTGSPVEPLPEEDQLRSMFEAFAESGLMVTGTFQVGAQAPDVGGDGLPILEEPEP